MDFFKFCAKIMKTKRLVSDMMLTKVPNSNAVKGLMHKYDSKINF